MYYLHSPMSLGWKSQVAVPWTWSSQYTVFGLHLCFLLKLSSINIQKFHIKKNTDFELVLKKNWKVFEHSVLLSVCGNNQIELSIAGSYTGRDALWFATVHTLPLVLYPNHSVCETCLFSFGFATVDFCEPSSQISLREKCKKPIWMGRLEGRK